MDLKDYIASIPAAPFDGAYSDNEHCYISVRRDTCLTPVGLPEREVLLASMDLHLGLDSLGLDSEHPLQLTIFPDRLVMTVKGSDEEITFPVLSKKEAVAKYRAERPKQMAASASGGESDDSPM